MYVTVVCYLMYTVVCTVAYTLLHTVVCTLLYIVVYCCILLPFKIILSDVLYNSTPINDKQCCIFYAIILILEVSYLIFWYLYFDDNEAENKMVIVL